jgi:hypothetical protein
MQPTRFSATSSYQVSNRDTERFTTLSRIAGIFVGQIPMTGEYQALKLDRIFIPQLRSLAVQRARA